MIRFLKWCLIVLIVVAAGIGFAGARYFERYIADSGPTTAEQVVQIPRGAGFGAITEILRDAGLIEEPLLFRLHGWLSGLDTKLKAGEYLVPAAASPRDLLALLASGDALMHRVTVPEGLTVVEVLQIIAGADKLTGDLPEHEPEQGTLLPETYLIQRGESRRALVARMAADLDDVLERAWAGRMAGIPLADKREALILASIIEKETARPDEYGLVASVFVNRLNKGMLLQTDPTVIYALTEGKSRLGRPLRFKDLEVDHPYNTYRYPGLPPGPIANPGRGAILAAVNPDPSDYFYFVADGTGGHAFARTLAEHNRNVAHWRKVQRAPKPPARPVMRPVERRPLEG